MIIDLSGPSNKYSMCVCLQVQHIMPKRKKVTANRPKSPPRQHSRPLRPAEGRQLIEASDSDSVSELSDNDNYDSDYLETESGSDAEAADNVAPSTSRQPAGHQSSTNWSSSFDSAAAEFCPGESVGPRNIPPHISAQSHAHDFLSLFWTDDMWKLITDETNRQAEYVKAKKPNNYVAKSFTPVTVEEMQAFVGCRVAMEMLVDKNRYEQYWRQKNCWLTRTPGFADVFTRDNFLALWTMLHCVDEESADIDKGDKIYKVRPILDHLLKNFTQFYVPNCELSLDEGMIPSKNHLSFKQYIRLKPIKWGIKCVLLCESRTGYIVNVEVYTGKVNNDSLLQAKLGVTGSLVARLCKPYAGQNYCVFTDRFYSSVTLAEYMLNDQGTRMCRTAVPSRKLFPKTLVKKKMEKGSSTMLYNGEVATLVWCDKRPIYFVATKYISHVCTTVQRYDAKEHKRMPVACPAVVKAYNENMGGADKNDQMSKLRRCHRHYRWPRRLFMKFFLWAAYNAYVMHNCFCAHNQTGQRLYTFHMFVNDLCHELVGSFRRNPRIMSRRVSGTSDARLVNSSTVPVHMAERATGASSNNRCAVCNEKYKQAKRTHPEWNASQLPKRSKTVYWCASCHVFLCIGSSDNNCFHAYHNKVQYWR